MQVMTRVDLEWWVELASTLDWRFATAYASGAPHDCVLTGKTEGFDAAAAERASRGAFRRFAAFPSAPEAASSARMKQLPEPPR